MMNDFNTQRKVLNTIAHKEYRVKKKWEQITEAESCARGEVHSGHTDRVFRPGIFHSGTLSKPSQNCPEVILQQLWERCFLSPREGMLLPNGVL